MNNDISHQEVHLSAQTLIMRLQEEEDTHQENDETWSASNNSAPNIVGQPPLRNARTGSLHEAELGQLVDAIGQCSAKDHRGHILVTVGIMALFAIPLPDLSTRARPLGQEHWPNPGDPVSRPDAAGLALWKPRGQAAWSGALVLPVARLADPPEGADVALLHRADALVPVQLAPEVALHLATLIGDLPEAGTYLDDAGHSRLRWDVEALAPCMAQFSSVLATHAPRLPRDPARIANTLQRVLDQIPWVDPAVVALLTGDQGRAQVTALYYSSVAASTLARALAQGHDAILWSMGAGSVRLRSFTDGAERRAGSCRAPMPRTVERALQVMAEYCGELAPQPARGLAGWIAHYNAQVHSMALHLHVVYGLRRNSSPSRFCERAEWSNGFFTVQDKGVWQRQLPVTCDTLQRWTALGAQLAQCQEVAAMLVDRPLLGIFQWLHARFERGELSQLLHVIRRDDDGRASMHRWSPTDLDAILAARGVAVPTQLWRHALRSHLVDMAAAPQDVDAILGHHRIGDEPWTLSTFEIPHEFLPRLRGILERRMQALQS